MGATHFDWAGTVLLAAMALAMAYIAARLRYIADRLEPFLNSTAYRALSAA